MVSLYGLEGLAFKDWSRQLCFCRLSLRLQPWAPSVGPEFWDLYMSYSLNSLKGGYIGDCIGNYYRAY